MTQPTEKEINDALYGETKRKSKYGVDLSDKGKEARTADNILFDSIREKDRYLQLKMLVRAGTIRNLERQFVFSIDFRNTCIGTYKADFCYMSLDGKLVVEDVKGARTPLYKFKKKCVEALYGIRILET